MSSIEYTLRLLNSWNFFFFSIFIVRRRDAYVAHRVTVRGFVEGGEDREVMEVCNQRLFLGGRRLIFKPDWGVCIVKRAEFLGTFLTVMHLV